MKSQCRFGRLPDVQRLVPLSRSRIYELVAANRFPKPFKLSDRASAWDMRLVEEWVESRAVADGRVAPSKAARADGAVSRLLALPPNENAAAQGRGSGARRSAGLST
jgi:prophage regulatory protein